LIRVGGFLRSSFSGFRFESFWLKEEDIGRVIVDVWKERGPSFSAQDFLLSFSSVLIV
jgi:hypothetical protein